MLGSRANVRQFRLVLGTIAIAHIGVCLLLLMAQNPAPNGAIDYP